MSFNGRDLLPAGHIKAPPGATALYEATFHAERIEVDENRWFPLFRKDRWFHRITTAAELGGMQWSVNVPQIWQHMRIFLELADRILKALMAEKHPFMETLLFGHMGRWKDFYAGPDVMKEPFQTALVLLSMDKYRQVWNARRPRTRRPPGYTGGPAAPLDAVDPRDIFPHDRHPITHDEWYTRFANLTKNQQWSIMNQHDEGSKSTYGMTVYKDGGMICLNNHLIFQLMKGGLTLSEQCFTYLLLAVTTLHELAHAITYRRFLERRTRYTDVPVTMKLNQYIEPFVDFRGQSEMGYAFETAVFGGAIRSSHLMSHEAAIPLAVRVESWPFPTQSEKTKGLGKIYPGHPDLAPGVPINRTIVTASFVSKMMSELFWKQVRHKAVHFRCVALFRGTTPNQPDHPWSWPRYANEIELNNELISRRISSNILGRIERDMIASWTWNKEHWQQRRRGWYDSEKQKWASSPWGAHTTQRAYIDRFSVEFQKGPNRSLKSCHGIVKTLTQRNVIRSSLPLNEYKRRLSVNPNFVYYHLVCLLMQACLPVRRTWERHQGKAPSPSDFFVPSREGLLAGKQPLYLSVHVSDGDENETLPASEFWDPFASPSPDAKPAPKPAHLIDQTDYLDLVRKVIEHQACEGVVMSAPWLGEILRVEASIRTQREALRASVPDDQERRSTCVSWDFSTPPYDKAVCRWDPENNTWQPASPPSSPQP
ncbi:hypothetical protein F5Y17DRAFT_244624 [Xylariaceae sp. FL0594]|nr:hypothetical protein F5Y17DRAFT_244624 [Xylariaceae sp. FL0594]